MKTHTPQRDRGAVSALEAALNRVGDRWSLLVVSALLDGPRRFNDLLEGVPGIAPNILADRLRRLERERVVTGQPYSQRPTRLAYSLTAEGHELAGVLRLLAGWASRSADAAADGVRHQACGSLLEARWFCPTCARPVEGPETSSLRLV